MKTVMVFFMLSLAACAKAQSTPGATAQNENCISYASPFEVQWPDSSIRKADVADCGSNFKATALDATADEFEASALTVQLKNETTGVPFLTNFDEQLQ